jgi:NADP-dependent 3-hydroxy acid dehydrogenase YdfG
MKLIHWSAYIQFWQPIKINLMYSLNHLYGKEILSQIHTFWLKKMIGYLISINAIPKPNSLYGKVAAITGASSGIGKAIAIELAKLGVSVSLTARRAEQLKLVCEEITKLGHNAMYVVGDVTNQTQMKDWIEQTKKQFGNIDILVNCAGIMPCTMMESCHFDEWNKCIDINMKGVLNGIGCVLQDFIKRGRGDIVTISSNAGRQVWEALTVYSATKFGVEAISGGLRKETYGKGIRVMSIQPGDVKTEIYDHDNTEPAAMQKIINQWAPKVLDPEDVARAVAYALKQPDHVAINEILIEPI